MKTNMSRYFSEMQKKSAAKRWAGSKPEDRVASMRRVRSGLSVKPPVKVVDPDTGRISYPRSVADSPLPAVPAPVTPKDAPNPIVVLPVATPVSVPERVFAPDKVLFRPKRSIFDDLQPKKPVFNPDVVRGVNWSGKVRVPASSEPFVE
jgi:hypothetical protein